MRRQEGEESSSKEPRMNRNMQKTNGNPKMNSDFFRYLPPEITMDIILKLPIESILSCKFVCKSWIKVVESPEFSKLHFPKSVPGLVVFQGTDLPNPYKILEFTDEIGPQNYAHYCKAVLGFPFPHHAQIHSSVNGLLFMYDQDLWKPEDLFICNPITRDYIELPPPCPDCLFLTCTFGFGVSKMTGQYKVVMIYRVCIVFCPPDCEVYTLGTRSWRTLETSLPLRYEGHIAAFLNGNLHWLAFDIQGYPLISSFDLETEVFSTFSSPPNRPHNPEFCCISVLGDCLCLCDNSANEIVVWLMKEYVDEKSWRKEFIIKKPTGSSLRGFRFPIKVFKDGEILIADKYKPGFLCYSSKARTIQEFDPFQACSRTSTVFYTPTFLSVKMFAVANFLAFLTTNWGNCS